MLENNLEKQRLEFERSKKNLEYDFKEKERLMEVAKIQR
jgi:hypothetical protein